jgi:hypothetical protein
LPKTVRFGAIIPCVSEAVLRGEVTALRVYLVLENLVLLLVQAVGVGIADVTHDLQELHSLD